MGPGRDILTYGTGEEDRYVEVQSEMIGETKTYGRHTEPGMTHGDGYAGCVPGET